MSTYGPDWNDRIRLWSDSFTSLSAAVRSMSIAGVAATWALMQCTAVEIGRTQALMALGAILLLLATLLIDVIQAMLNADAHDREVDRVLALSEEQDINIDEASSRQEWDEDDPRYRAVGHLSKAKRYTVLFGGCLLLVTVVIVFIMNISLPGQ